MITPEAYRRKIEELNLGPVRIMEVCGTHTMAIAASGIKNILPDNITLISGPGCPVCVTDQSDIDTMISLTERNDVIIAAYGDMLRIPGSTRGDSLLRRKRAGASVEMVYSPVDALEIAKANPDKEVVFTGIGFETTSPGTAAAVLLAKEQGIQNFSVFVCMKRVEPALRALLKNDPTIDGLICPGHVAVVTGAEAFRFLPEEYGIPSVISGFETEDILLTVYMLLKQIKEGTPKLQNEYKRAVSETGNPEALRIMDRVFEKKDALWRGLGLIKDSGFAFREAFWDYDATSKLQIDKKYTNNFVEIQQKCLCGEVICGRISPITCSHFGKDCTPSDPIGPCMVSSEGSCAAAYKYRKL